MACRWITLSWITLSWITLIWPATSRMLAASESGAPVVAVSSLPADAEPLHGVLPNGCLPGERGYFQATLRGALNEQIDWRGISLDCTGDARPGGAGIRLSLAGALPHSSSRLRIIIGVAAQPGLAHPAAAPANLTVIVEGAGRIYSTLGDSRCSVEGLRQEPLPLPASTPMTISVTTVRAYRVAGRGYCIDPAITPRGNEKLYIDRFDFSARAEFESESLHVPAKN